MKRMDLYEQIHRATDQGKHDEALRLARELQGRFPRDENVAPNIATALIDAGNGLEDARLVEEGIGWFEAHVPREVLPRTPREAILLYNLANGYAARQRLRRLPETTRDVVDLSEDPYTKVQKVLFQRAAHAHSLVDPDLRARALVNYGNLLHELGRFVEAAEQYDLALTARPRHPPALVNSAATHLDIAHLARQAFEPHLLELHRRLWLALRSSRILVRSAGARLRGVAEARLKRIEKELERHGGLEIVSSRVNRKEFTARKGRTRPARVLGWFARHGLFLSINARLPKAHAYWKDEIEIAPFLVGGWPKQAQRQLLAARLNEMRSDYATARHLLASGAYPATVLCKLDQVRSSGMLVPGTDWSMSLGLTKAAYRLAADVLDKAAGYLNVLFSWGHEDRNVSIKTVWYENRERSRGFSKEVRRVLGRNPYVRGLYDLSLDWQDKDLLSGHQEIRHALTHRYVPIHVEPVSDEREGIKALTPDAIRSMALLMVHTARAVIIQTVGAAEVEVAHRLRATVTPISEVAIEAPDRPDGATPPTVP